MEENGNFQLKRNNLKRRSRLSLFLCFLRQRPKRSESLNSTAPLLPDVKPSNSKPQYYILSEVGSDLTDSPEQSFYSLVENESKTIRFPRFRIWSPKCWKLHGTPKEDTSCLEKETTAYIYDENNTSNSLVKYSGPSMQSSCAHFDSYPSQSLRNHVSDNVNSPSSSIRGKNKKRRIYKEVLLNVSVKRECAQLVVDSGRPDDEINHGSLLGVAFPHPVVPSPTENDYKYCLGVYAGHPYWVEREKNLQHFKDSGLLDRQLTVALPSSIIIETSHDCLLEEQIVRQEAWKPNIYDPICKIMPTSQVPFDEVAMDLQQKPFDEIAIDMMRGTVDQHILPEGVSDSASHAHDPCFEDEESLGESRWPGCYTHSYRPNVSGTGLYVR